MYPKPCDCCALQCVGEPGFTPIVCQKMNAGGPSVSTAESFLEVVKGTEAGSGQHKPQHASLALARLHFE